jgi:hypothetical protein
MRHFIFHIPLLISERAYDPEANAHLVKDAGRVHLDLDIMAEDMDRAVVELRTRLQVCFGDDLPPETVPRPYVGPV